MKASRITAPLCRFLFLSTIFVVLNPIIASPPLSPRQESIWELPSSQQIIDSLGAGWGIIKSFFDGFESPQQLENGLPEDSTKTDPLVQPQRLQTNDDECSQQPVGAPDNQCNVGTSRIIFARDCGNDAQNTAIGQLLTKTVYSGSVSTVADDDCGVVFWAGEFTEESAERIRITNGVLGVEPDIPLYDTSNRDFRQVKTKNKKRSGESESDIRKRDTLITQPPPVSTDLSFVSNPPNHIGDGYVYHSAAGEGINVYVIDTGADARNKDFSSGAIKRWIHTSSVPRTEPEMDFEGHGTCVASKVAGIEYGVAKKASLIMVKIAKECHSPLPSPPSYPLSWWEGSIQTLEIGQSIRISGFLSSKDVGPMLRKTPGLIVQAVKQYIMDSAYIRPEGIDKAIWNQAPTQPWHLPLTA